MAETPLPFEKIEYGPAKSSQFLRLYRPSGSSSGGKPTLWVVIHGGFWKKKYTVDNALVHTLPPFLVKEGRCVAILEYRRVGEPGGGWPGSNVDVLSALNKLHEMSSHADCSFSAAQTVVVGHSAGGTLALWLACSGSEESLRKFFARFTAAPPPVLRLPLALIVAVAPVCDLREGQEVYRLSDEGDAIARYLSCYKEYDRSSGSCCGRSAKAVAAVTEDLTEQYRYASPSENLPLRTDALLVAGEDDTVIPVKSVEDFYYRHGIDRRSAQLSYQPLPGDHFQLMDAHALFARVYARAKEALAAGADRT